MTKGVYNYYDPEYNPGSTEGDVLLMSVNDASFSFVIVDSATKKILVWGENFPESELIHPAELVDILNADYDEVKAVVLSNSFTIIPKSLYKESDTRAYSKFVSAKANDTVLTNEFDDENLVVFKVGEDIVKNISNFVDLKSVFFGGKVLAAAVLANHPLSNALYLHIEANKLHVLCFDNGSMKFYNIYDFANADELAYFVVLAANELNLDFEYNELVISGELDANDKKLSRLNELMPNIKMNNFRMLDLPESFMPHQVFFLSGLTLCESLVEN